MSHRTVTNPSIAPDRCLRPASQTSRRPAAIALVARALRAAGRKAKPKEISYG
jgi:hypothetical protein